MKKINKKNNKKSNGITLIALVITIIVLLILAGVSISILAGDNGLLSKASTAKTNTKKAEEEEQVKLQVMGSYNKEGVLDLDELENNLSNIPGVTVSKSNGEFTISYPGGNSYKVDSNGNVIPISSGPEVSTIAEAKSTGKVFNGTENPIVDNFGNEVIIPEGFKIANDSADNVTGGIVIEDADSSKHPNTVGSQFVWIPVGKVYTDVAKTEENAKTFTLGRYEFLYDGTPKPYPGDHTEDTASNHNPIYGNAIAKDIEDFIAKANSKKGYYIGRYEARVENWTGEVLTTNENSEISWTGYTNGKLVEKGNAQVFHYTTQNKASELSRTMYSSSDFESDLMNSYARDTATWFLQEFDNRTDELKTNPYYEGKYSLQTMLSYGLKYTGTNNIDIASNIDKICNVYDMADNFFEWSTETYLNADEPCTTRGGDSVHNVSYVCSRIQGHVYTADENDSFRPILYIN